MARFHGKTILVTGAANGQGAEEARMLVAEGAAVILTDVQDEKGEALARQLGPDARYRHLDVSEPAGWQQLAAEFRESDPLHGLVNNAGIYRPRSIEETDVALMELHFRINQLGTFLGIKYMAPLLARAGAGSIVNISSIAGLRGGATTSAYGGTKWAVRGITKTAALELAAAGIRVNSVHPGLVDTEMLPRDTPAKLEARIKQIPMQRMGTAKEIAKLVLFLLSDDSSYITGAEIAIDGGVTL